MMTRTQTWLLFFALLVGTMLACNIPLTTPDILSAPVTPTLSFESTEASSDVTPTRTSRPTRTPVPTADPNEITETETPLPTFTPITLAPTVTPPGATVGDDNDEESDTDTREATTKDIEDDIEEDGETATADSEFETLELQFDQTWNLIPDDPGFALATVVLTATGGDGEYSYFRDDNQQKSAEFEYRWRACVDNAGTFRVDSGDGQSVTVDFSETSPCSE